MTTWGSKFPSAVGSKARQCSRSAGCRCDRAVLDAIRAPIALPVALLTLASGTEMRARCSDSRAPFAMISVFAVSVASTKEPVWIGIGRTEVRMKPSSHPPCAIQGICHPAVGGQAAEKLGLPRTGCGDAAVEQMQELNVANSGAIMCWASGKTAAACYSCECVAWKDCDIDCDAVCRCALLQLYQKC